MEPQWLGSRSSSFALWPPADGKGVLRMRLLVSTFEGKFKDLPRAHLWVKAGRRLLDTPEIDALPNKPQELVYHIQVDDLPLGRRGWTCCCSRWWKCRTA